MMATETTPAVRPQPQIQPCRYKVGKTLGAGSYSVVKECVHIDTGRYYAAKVINKRLMAGREHMVRNEIAVLKKVSMGHQNILTLVDYFETMNNLYLVTDLALGGELFDRICRKGSYYESDAADLIRATLSAVAYLHDHGIVHRDLKPENLLFRTPEDNADLLIADFGLSRIMDEEQFHVLTTTCGTPGYMAPEIFKKTGHGKPVDVWALGVITYFLLCGYTPFDRDSDFEEMQAILNADYSFTPAEYWRNVSSHAKDFIRRCLTVDPNKRMTAHEALQHPFVAAGPLMQLANAGQTAGAISGERGYPGPTGHLVATGPEGTPASTDGADVDSAGNATNTNAQGQTNLLPTVKKNFNARRTLHAAIDTVRAINKLREAQAVAAAGFMDGTKSREPERGRNGPATSITSSLAAARGVVDPDATPVPSAAGTLTNASMRPGGGLHDSGVSVADRASPGANSNTNGYQQQQMPSQHDSGYGTQPDLAASLPDRARHSGERGPEEEAANGAEDVDMTDAPPPAASSSQHSLDTVPVSLRPGMDVNRVVETSKGLWSAGSGGRR